MTTFESKNSQHSTMWITDGVNSKKVEKNAIIPDGWRLGRVIQKMRGVQKTPKHKEKISVSMKKHKRAL